MTTNRQRRARSGAKPSPFDGRDWMWSSPVLSVSEPVLTLPFGPRDQGEAHCCVGAAVAGAMELLAARGGTSEQLSPLFSYYMTRGLPSYTGPVSIRETLRSANRSGICASSFHEGAKGPQGPYTREDALVSPSIEAIWDASARRLANENPQSPRTGYFRLYNGVGASERWTSALQNGCPVIFGFTITPSYERLWSGAETIEDVSGEVGSELHVALAYGHRPPWFIVRDSRGAAFGSAGSFRVRDSLVDSMWMLESWVVRALEP